MIVNIIDRLQAAFLLFWLYLFNMIDLVLSIYAFQHGAYELNPLGFETIIRLKMFIPVLLYFAYVRKWINDKMFVGIIVLISLVCFINISNIYYLTVLK